MLTPRRALEGIVVLDLGTIYNGSYCGALLAQAGADVVKVEPPSGEQLRWRGGTDEVAAEFVMLNASKRSIAIDIKQPVGRDLLRSLANAADVLIENYAPGTAERLGIGPDELLAINPRLVYASGKGYGREGPYAHMPAMDLTVQAMSGVIATTGFPDGPPVKAGPGLVDFLSGTHLFGGVVTALFQRERTGEGQLVEVSMHDAVYPTLASAIGGLVQTTDVAMPERTGNRHSGLSIAPYNVYPARDGYLAVIGINDRHWRGVARAMGRPELADDPVLGNAAGRRREMDLVDQLLDEWTRPQYRWHAVKALHREGVPAAPVLTVREVTNDPHLEARGMLCTVETPTGRHIPVPGPVIRMSQSAPLTPGAAPDVGEHGTEVLRDLLDLDPQAIEGLVADGAVALGCDGRKEH